VPARVQIGTHWPVALQVDVPLHVVGLLSGPFVTGTSHAPVDPQLVHAAQFADPQQIPSRQCLLAHSPSAVHAAPSEQEPVIWHGAGWHVVLQ
jgi:hypothetical protein